MEMSAITISKIIDVHKDRDFHTIDQFDDDLNEDINFIDSDNNLIPIKKEKLDLFTNIFRMNEESTTLIEKNTIKSSEIRYLTFKEGINEIEEEYKNMKKIEIQFQKRLYDEMDFYFDD